MQHAAATSQGASAHHGYESMSPAWWRRALPTRLAGSRTVTGGGAQPVGIRSLSSPGRELGEVVVDVQDSGCYVFGRCQGGQGLWSDSSIQKLMYRLGHLDHVPPLGALNPDARETPRIKVNMRPREFQFKIPGYPELANVELGDLILSRVYRVAGWEVVWGSCYESEAEGLVRHFKIIPLTGE